ncbi:MAG: cell division protein ZapD [Gammaproteobacteria bacterium]
MNERVRTFLRLEFLFNIIEHYQDGMSETDIRVILNTLFDITDLIGRTDIKGELIKELERQNTSLEALQDKPGVDTDRLKAILEDIKSYLSELRSAQYQPGQAMRQDELLTVVKQRNTMPGRACNFDLPSYHHWLHRSREEHAVRLKEWQQDLAVIRNGVFLVLHLIRNRARSSSETAAKGFFQQALEASAGCHMIRVLLPENAACYPEISGGKHRFTVRFMEQPDTGARPTQVNKDVDFELQCCMP